MPSDRSTGFSSAFDEMLERSRRELDALSGGSDAPALSPAPRTSSPDFPPNASPNVLRAGREPHFRERAGRIGSIRPGGPGVPFPGGARTGREARDGLALRGPGTHPRGRRAAGAMQGDGAGARREPHLVRVRPDVRSRTRRSLGDDRHGRERELHPGRRSGNESEDERIRPGANGRPNARPSNRRWPPARGCFDSHAPGNPPGRRPGNGFPDNRRIAERFL